MNNTLKTVIIALVTSIATLTGYKMLGFEERAVILNESQASRDSVGNLVNFTNVPSSTPGDFTFAASTSAPAVVHIKAKSIRKVRQQMPSIFDQFFGFDDQFGAPRSQEQRSSGSGVIISANGYIATNNHVVDGADELEVVTYDKQTYKATVIGTDPSTDLAVIKIEAKKLPTLAFGNSDQARVGEWVLAVGNPFNLESTVTAGIVSAIGRDISILQRSFNQRYQESGREGAGDTPIESFIQTDAAVNPGNSGGALVNLAGELIGINTAIASPNGAYAGYAFAVPSSIVKKVTTDIIKFGNVQRGYLGVNPVELDSKNVKEYDTKVKQGIYVADLPDNGAAAASGIEKGDVIISVDGIPTISEPKFRELIGRKRPGESLNVTVNRDGKEKEYKVVLRNREGGKSIIKKVEPKAVTAKLGAEFEELSSSDLENLGIRSGVKVSSITRNGNIARDTDIKAGFIVTRVGNDRVNSVNDIEKVLEKAEKNKDDGILICGIYEGVSRNFCYGVAL